jgi:small subunit ribosomal protein S4
MAVIKSEEQLTELYGEPSARAAAKVIDRLDGHCRQFIANSPFIVLATSGGDSLDVSPKGDPAGFVQVEDDHHLIVPDRPGNNRIDGLLNLLHNPAVALIFLIPSVDESQVQDRPPDGRKHLGASEIPRLRREYGPGQHGQRRKGKLSDFGLQLRAKQKLKGYYGDLTEKQFRRIFSRCRASAGDTGELLIGLLERRLDAVVYRAKFVPTVFAARQFVNHGHVTVNGQRVNIPSYRVKEGDVIEVREKSKQMAAVLRPCSCPSVTCRTTSRPTIPR